MASQCIYRQEFGNVHSWAADRDRAVNIWTLSTGEKNGERGGECLQRGGTGSAKDGSGRESPPAPLERKHPRMFGIEEAFPARR